jgi:hypothetical protein
VATDQKISVVDAEDEQAGGVIENELPTYRAISKTAVFSLLFGILALFSFTHWFFYLFAILAIVTGIAANRIIGRYPDILTGGRLARAGIALGMIFGLTAGTVATVQSYVLTRDAERFAKAYCKLLTAPNLGEAIWWNMHPDQRRSKSPIDYLHEFEAARGRERMGLDMKMGPLFKVRRRLDAAKGEEIHFLKIERAGTDDSRGVEMPVYALAIFELDGPGSKEFPDKQEFAAALIKARTKDRKYEWWVEETIFPYKLSSFVPAEKPVGDEHGHSH